VQYRVVSNGSCSRGDGWEDKSRKDAQDGDDHQALDESESTPSPSGREARDHIACSRFGVEQSIEGQCGIDQLLTHRKN
jgi:hypothetical protein